MTSLIFTEILNVKSSSKFAVALVMSLLLSACGGGAGGEDSLVNSSNVDSQTQEDVIEEQAPVEIAPVQITSQPQNLTVNAGENASFSVSVIGGGTLSFQWRKNQQNIQGATSNSLTLTDVSDSDGALYDVVVSNSAGTLSSLSALLAVNTEVVVGSPAIEPVVIVSQPQALSVNETASANFSVQVSGDGEIVYQWLRNGEVLVGEVSANLNLGSVSMEDAGSYSVIVSNSAGPVISDVAALSVTVTQVASSIQLSWDIPQEREDGSDLSLGEINGYVIAYGIDANDMSNQLTVEGASVTNVILDGLSSGTYYFSIATIDSEGVQGDYSGVIQQAI